MSWETPADLREVSQALCPQHRPLCPWAASHAVGGPSSGSRLAVRACVHPGTAGAGALAGEALVQNPRVTPENGVYLPAAELGPSGTSELCHP